MLKTTMDSKNSQPKQWLYQDINLITHTKEVAKKYNKLNDDENRFGRTDYLITQELPGVLKKHAVNSAILDFGCGAGLSTRFIKKMGYDCIGVDINENMLNFARTNDPSGKYIKSISDNKLPFHDHAFDLAISTFVLFEIPSIEKMISIFKEISRVLRDGGIFIAITGSEELYKRNWLTLNVKDFPENINPKSGDICRINLSHIGLTLNDYFWTDNDYTNVAESTGFAVINRLYPLGKINKGIQWKDEIYYPPFVFYEFKKNS